MEPWEALDVDDSDLPSLLRPCKRRHHQTTTTTTIPLSQPLLTPITQTLTQKLSKQQSPQSHSSQQPQHSNPNPKPPRRIIPGPAGHVQSAMLRKALDRENLDPDMDPIPTQKYIEKAVANASEFDHDFEADPWLSALEYLGVVNGVVPSIPLSSIKEYLDVGKVDRVVAVIKSSTPNGLGGLMVTLKDPTGTIGASIHNKVLAESEFGKDLSLGSVVILRKVAIFAPSQSAYYLNITLQNLIKVFSKNSGPPSKRNSCASAIRYDTANMDHCGEAARHEDMSTSGRGTAREILEDMRRHTNKNQFLQRESQSEKENRHPGPLDFQNRVSLKEISALAKQTLISRQETVSVPSEGRIAGVNGDHDECYIGERCDPPREGSSGCSLIDTNDAANLIINNTDEGSQKAGTTQKQTQLLVSQASVPQWTDEQLEELFASYDEDDGFMF